METESILTTATVERVATLKLVRVVDYEKLAEENGGSVSTDMIREAGKFEIVIVPNGRDAKTIRQPVASHLAGTSFLDGFEACAELKRKGPRTPKTPAQKAAAKKKREAAAKKKAK